MDPTDPHAAYSDAASVAHRTRARKVAHAPNSSSPPPPGNVRRRSRSSKSTHSYQLRQRPPALQPIIQAAGNSPQRCDSAYTASPHECSMTDGSCNDTASCDSTRQIILYKTEICRSWEETGICRYGNKCQFAHSFNELRSVDRHPKYKTEICRSFQNQGWCPYGRRCCFIHNDCVPFKCAVTSNMVATPPPRATGVSPLPPHPQQQCTPPYARATNPAFDKAEEFTNVTSFDSKLKLVPPMPNDLHDKYFGSHNNSSYCLAPAAAASTTSEQINPSRNSSWCALPSPISTKKPAPIHPVPLHHQNRWSIWDLSPTELSAFPPSKHDWRHAVVSTVSPQSPRPHAPYFGDQAFKQAHAPLTEDSFFNSFPNHDPFRDASRDSFGYSHSNDLFAHPDNQLMLQDCAISTYRQLF